MDSKHQILMRASDCIEGSILTDLSFKPVAVDRGAQTLIGALGNDSTRREPARSLPQDLLVVLQELNRDELADACASFRIGTIGYLCRVSLMTPCNGPNSQPLLALYIQKNPNGSDVFKRIAERFDLTDREYEALLNISTGLTCKEVAQRMKISPNTVKAFLRLIMIKMGVTRRAGILSKVLELTQNGNGTKEGSKHEE